MELLSEKWFYSLSLSLSLYPSFITRSKPPGLIRPVWIWIRCDVTWRLRRPLDLIRQRLAFWHGHMSKWVFPHVSVLTHTRNRIFKLHLIFNFTPARLGLGTFFVIIPPVFPQFFHTFLFIFTLSLFFFILILSLCSCISVTKLTLYSWISRQKNRFWKCLKFTCYPPTVLRLFLNSFACIF